MPIIYSSLNHALRAPLAAEIHSRPFLQLDAPELISHLAVFAESDTAPERASTLSQAATLAALCRHFGVAAPAAEAKYFYHDFGRFRLKWECHTEFATYTFASRPHDDGGAPDDAVVLADAFTRMPVTQLPQEWLMSLKGQLIVAAHVVLDRSGGTPEAFALGLKRVFEGNILVGSEVLEGGELWTDFAIQPDGFSRFVVRDVAMRAQQSGRLVQRVLEIETYRMMALIGLPRAQQAAPLLNDIENALATLADTMVDSDGQPKLGMAYNGDEEQVLLDSIIRLASRIEQLSLDNSYRFSASRAYFRLVQARIDELREVRIGGFPTVGEFMDRRLTPAMNTCEAINNRQGALAQRIANTNDLLRTRVGIVQERQNRQILQSMDKRAAQQLHLQQAVEGLSVAAITYYVIALFGYAGKAAEKAGLIAHPEIIEGLLVPVVAAAVWLGIRKMHKRMHAEIH